MNRYLAILAGQISSLLGSKALSFALGIWVYQESGSVTDFALIAAFTLLPSIVFGPLAGLLADRVDRRRIMMAADSMSAVFTLVLFALFQFDLLSLPYLYLLVFLRSVCDAFQGPAFIASSAMLVPKEKLGRASGISEAGSGLVEGLGPLVGGALLSMGSLELVFLVDFVSYFCAILPLLFIKIPMPKQPPKEELVGVVQNMKAAVADVAEGWRFIRERVGLLFLLGFFVSINLTLGIAEIVFTPLVLSFATELELGGVFAFGAVGYVAGSVIVSVWHDPKSRIEWIIIPSFLQGLLLLLAGAKPSLMLVTIGVAGYMMMLPIVFAHARVIWLERTPHHMQGRVYSFRAVVTTSAILAAFVFAGPLSDFVFEPIMQSSNAISDWVGPVIGTGQGRGAALMMVTLGCAAMVVSSFAWGIPRLRNVEREVRHAI